MCTVILHVPDESAGPGGTVRMLAIRDEDPDRPWRGPGPWWPETYPGVVGIQDERSGGAWLALSQEARRVTVVLNRHEHRTPTEPVTRGVLPLESVTGGALPPLESVRGFNLVEINGLQVEVTSWDGVERRTVALPAGTHMVAHDDVNSELTARIVRWLPEFRQADHLATDADWMERWTEQLARTAAEPADADHAIIRRQSFEGIRSHSLLMCLVAVSETDVALEFRPFAQSGVWSDPGVRNEPFAPVTGSGGFAPTNV